MCDVKLCSLELKSLRGTRPYPCGFRNSAVEAQRLKTRQCRHREKHGQRRREISSDVAKVGLAQMSPCDLLDSCYF